LGRVTAAASPQCKIRAAIAPHLARCQSRPCVDFGQFQQVLLGVVLGLHPSAAVCSHLLNQIGALKQERNGMQQAARGPRENSNHGPRVRVGFEDRLVAGELGLSEHTIKKYLLRIFDKVGISSRVELVLYAMSHGSNRPAEWMPGNA